MTAAKALDKRLQERELRQGQLSRKALEASVQALPDLASNVHQADDDELARLREELEDEQRNRSKRIERALLEPNEPPPPPPAVVPIEPEA
ncbi:MAG: hypothetical protein O7B23_01155 [Deltaproteobacteria bacterium]|nr:hypothetical protein [Deltaproteobacteria bacterium]MCZ6713626.1 hypothetical protein [Deltaproteobacteria bacterium]